MTRKVFKLLRMDNYSQYIILPMVMAFSLTTMETSMELMLPILVVSH